MCGDSWVPKRAWHGGRAHAVRPALFCSTTAKYRLSRARRCPFAEDLPRAEARERVAATPLEVRVLHVPRHQRRIVCHFPADRHCAASRAGKHQAVNGAGPRRAWPPYHAQPPGRSAVAQQTWDSIDPSAAPCVRPLLAFWPRVSSKVAALSVFAPALCFSRLPNIASERVAS